MSARIPPNDDSAEQALLGAMLLRAEAIEVAYELVQARDFYRPAHQHIYDAIIGLWLEGQPTDPVTVADVLRRSGLLDAIGGPGTLISVQTNTPSTSNAGRYAAIVAEMSQYRSLIAAATETAESAYDMAGAPGDLIERFGQRLVAIESDSPTDLPPDLSTLTEFLDRPAADHAPWAIPGLLRRGWRVMVVAGEGAGKSVLLRQVAISSAAGLHPFTHRPIPSIRSLVIDLENPDEAIEAVCAPMALAAAEVEGWDPDRCWLWRRPAGIDLRRRRDRLELEQVLRIAQPDLVCLGPVYKVYRPSGKDDEETATAAAQAVLDDLRARYRFALLLEHHAPHGADSKKRQMRPHGSVLWQRWPELGFGLEPVKDMNGSFTIGRFRGDRLPNQWPERLDRSGGRWPWDATWPAGTFDPDYPDEPEPLF